MEILQVLIKLWTLTVLVILMQQPVLSADLCHKGYLLYTPRYGPDVCLKCFSGQFMPHDQHNYRQCYLCTEIKNPQLEIFISPCNRTHDTIIHCIEGYYRTQPSYPDVRGQCQKCTDCTFPKRSCQEFSDTVCCPGDNYGVYIDQHGKPECVRECGRGQYLDSATGFCVGCPENTYMDDDRHIRMDYCNNCEIYESPHEKVLQVCNSTHPTIIGCEDGFYRRRKYDKSKRGEHSECVRLCGRGQYLDSDRGVCLTCPKYTYMDEDEHNHTDTCKSCYFPGSPNEIILQPCNSTHPTVIGCVNGYYRQRESHSNVCVPCRRCSKNTDSNIYEGRACDETRDAVCCPQPDMTVVDALDGPKCVVLTPRTKVCGKGEYLNTSDRTHEVTCQTCTLGTYMDETEHTRTSCKSCEEFPHKKHCPQNKSDPLPVDVDALTLGQALGLALGTTAIYLVLALGIYAWWKRRRRKAGKEHTPENMPMLEFPEEENNNCKRQKNFIPVEQFSNVHLPHQYCDEVMVDLVKLQAKLAVLVIVNGSSNRRPVFCPSTNKPYPYSGHKQRTATHKGNGWVENVKMYTNQPCPCVTCQQSSHSLTSWGEVVICTAASVVFDITEGRNCRCYLNYDRDLNPRPSLYGALKVFSDVGRDWCYMTFVTHDMDLIKHLQKEHIKYHRRRREIHYKYEVILDNGKDGESSEKLRLLKDRYVQSLALLEHYITDIRKNPSLDFFSNLFSTSQGYELTSSTCAMNYLLEMTSGDHCGDKKLETLLKMLSTAHKNFSHCLTDLENLDIQMKSDISETVVEDLALDKYRELFEKSKELDRFLRFFSFVLTGKAAETSSNENCSHTARYNAFHPLTVIVVETTGGKQKISLGEIRERKTSVFEYFTTYSYSNPLMPGCEGAHVFVLGKTGLCDLGHSKDSGGQGKSGAWSDIVPYIAELSAVLD